MPRHVNACVFDPVVDERIAWGSSIPIKCRKTLLMFSFALRLTLYMPFFTEKSVPLTFIFESPILRSRITVPLSVAK